jgi:hypothetical protein
MLWSKDIDLDIHPGFTPMLVRRTNDCSAAAQLPRSSGQAPLLEFTTHEIHGTGAPSASTKVRFAFT